MTQVQSCTKYFGNAALPAKCDLTRYETVTSRSLRMEVTDRLLSGKVPQTQVQF